MEKMQAEMVKELSYEQIEAFNKRGNKHKGLELTIPEYIKRPFILSVSENEFEIQSKKLREK